MDTVRSAEMYEVSFFPNNRAIWTELNAQDDMQIDIKIERRVDRDNITYYQAHACGEWNVGMTADEARNNLVRLINNCLSSAASHEPAVCVGERLPYKQIG